MQTHSNKIKEYGIDFVNTFDELNEIKRKLFNIPDIDKFLSFSDKKNICIVNRTKSFFLYSLITKICNNFHNANDKNDNITSEKTILIDAGNGNNLGYIYLNLVNKSLKDGFDIDKTLDKIIISRAFTFYQLANIIINEIPKLMFRLDGKIQVIILDLFDTLPPSSYIHYNKIKTVDKKYHLNPKSDFNYNIKLLDEMIDLLIDISNKYFVILSYNESSKSVKRSIVAKFSNVLEINPIGDTIEKKKKEDDDDNEIKLTIKTRLNGINKISPPINKITNFAKDCSSN